MRDPPPQSSRQESGVLFPNDVADDIVDARSAARVISSRSSRGRHAMPLGYHRVAIQDEHRLPGASDLAEHLMDAVEGSGSACPRRAVARASAPAAGPRLAWRPSNDRDSQQIERRSTSNMHALAFCRPSG